VIYRFSSGTQAGLRGKCSLCQSRKAYRGRTGKSPRTVDSESGHIHCAVALSSGKEEACSPGSSCMLLEPAPQLRGVMSGLAAYVEIMLSCLLYCLRSGANQTTSAS
jgi:hypothetical protein